MGARAKLTLNHAMDSWHLLPGVFANSTTMGYLPSSLLKYNL